MCVNKKLYNCFTLMLDRSFRVLHRGGVRILIWRFTHIINITNYLPNPTVLSQGNGPLFLLTIHVIGFLLQYLKFQEFLI